MFLGWPVVPSKETTGLRSAVPVLASVTETSRLGTGGFCHLSVVLAAVALCRKHCLMTALCLL